ncbi:hypothetical protein B0T19DRAFT_446262 [Cercophora scortea]|uniref:Uncharacterized protein n=1 Tax=Cercophora scortea TaxID=314031 RepID=A0AAE0I2Y8_9PEZI|nr:hypothetical protein B0T19DRAFT_446262 [Cercophora scortea]
MSGNNNNRFYPPRNEKVKMPITPRAPVPTAPPGSSSSRQGPRQYVGGAAQRSGRNDVQPNMRSSNYPPASQIGRPQPTSQPTAPMPVPSQVPLPAQPGFDNRMYQQPRNAWETLIWCMEELTKTLREDDQVPRRLEDMKRGLPPRVEMLLQDFERRNRQVQPVLPQP